MAVATRESECGDCNQSASPATGVTEPKMAGWSPARSTRSVDVVRDEREARAAATTDVPAPPLTERQTMSMETPDESGVQGKWTDDGDPVWASRIGER
ncbi:unannotated protein [freshwater metagenome]|uniref:Unannotated protein n=1 Tax=freshwater metagenome TaxID=449393 RepID=A0A6J6FC57_9ZZZZ